MCPGERMPKLWGCICLKAGGEVNTTVTFLKDKIAANSFNGAIKDGKAKKAVLIPKNKIKEEVIRKINKCK